MKRRFTALLTLVLLLLWVVPAGAQVNLNINGKSFVPAATPLLEEGVTSVPLYVVGRVLGAEVTVEDDGQIIINENGNELKMKLGSRLAAFNGESRTLPRAPEMIDGEIMVPLRFVAESFSAQVGWQQEGQQVLVNYQEKRNGLTVEEMLAKTSQTMLDLNTYKMNIGLHMSTQVKGEDQKTESMNMSGKIEAACQQKPLTMYLKQVMSGSIGEGAAESETISSEAVINQKGFFMTMPDIGWVKMDIPGLDMETLMEQGGSQDIIKSIQQMHDSGVLMSYANDQDRDGQGYWVINVTMGPESFNKYIQTVMEELPEAAAATTEPDSTPDIKAMMGEIFKNMQADVVYDLWIDQGTGLTKYMDLDARINMAMTLPDEKGVSSKFGMNIQEKANYELYDFGQNITVPDIQNAVNFTEYLEQQLAENPSTQDLSI